MINDIITFKEFFHKRSTRHDLDRVYSLSLPKRLNYSQLMNTQEKLKNYLVAKSHFPNSYDLIIMILMKYNCRIQEILNAEWKDFYPERFLILKGLKKSSNVIVTDSKILDLILQIPKIDSIKIFPFITYYSVYHFIKTKFSHLLSSIRTRKNRKITHAFRYLNIVDLQDETQIRDVLHHRSIKSQSYYKNKIKK